jgi:hypothetical protein
MTAVADGLLTPGFTIYGPAGQSLTSAFGDDVASALATAPAAGTYTIVASDFTAGLTSTGDYALSLSVVTPSN